MDIIKRLDVEQKGVGARAAVLWLTASDTGLQVASGIVTLLFTEGEMGVESQCPSRDRWAYCPVGKKSHNSASGSHVCNPSSSDLWSAVISHSWQSDYSQQPLNSSHIQVALDSTRLLVKTVFRVEGWGRTATKNVCELWHRGLDILFAVLKPFPLISFQRLCTWLVGQWSILLVLFQSQRKFLHTENCRAMKTEAFS